MKTYIDDQFMTITDSGGVLTLRWKVGSKKLTDESFKEEAIKLIDVVKKLQSKKIIVDMRKFGYRLSDDLIEWRKKNVIAIYNQIGVEKFAFISDSPTIKQDAPGNTFVTREFSNFTQANDWIIEL